MEPVPDQGDVYRVVLEGIGHEERGPHYAIVVSDEAYNHGSTVVVIPFSSPAREATVHPATAIKGTRTRAMVEQLRAVDKSSRSNSRQPTSTARHRRWAAAQSG